MNPKAGELMNELEIIQHRRIDGLSVFFNTVDYRSAHFHPEWELVLVVNEELGVTCPKKKYTVKPGQMILFSPNMLHEFHAIGAGCTFLCMQVSTSLLRTPRELTVDEIFVDTFLSEEKRDEIRLRLREVMDAYLDQEPHYELFCIGQTYLVFRELLCAMPNHLLTAEEQTLLDQRNRRLAALIRFVDENYMGKIRLSDFAEQEGYTMTYLSHFIKDAMNQSFQEYVTSVRMNCACKLMETESKRLLDICQESGFSDYRYFCRAFREQYGMTPEQYRRRLTKPESVSVHRSLHSLEQFYTREQSKVLLAELPI